MVTFSAPTDAELRRAYSGARVFVTGHTGFKGSWLTLWLRRLGAEVTGYALAPDATPSMFDAARVGEHCRTHLADVRDFDRLSSALNDARPDYVFHLAAQSLVRRSYAQPLETIETNVVGTANVLEAVRRRDEPCAAVIVTSDKCYENREQVWGYREIDPMGGHDVYSMSKGAAELVTSSYRRSFFADADAIRVASARAGNVIGGGDWAADRIVPDLARAVSGGTELVVRNPRAVRPWQHVLEPLGGYLLLGARLRNDKALAEAWNFGPGPENSCTVGELVETMIAQWGAGRWRTAENPNEPHEAHQLRLSIDKAVARLGWMPRWNLAETCARTAAWYRAFGERTAAMCELTMAQIDDYAGHA